MSEFQSFGKIPRFSRECVITEKIDGTNAQVLITEDGEFFTGSRNRWITPEMDNHGFSTWAHEHKDELISGLGVGRHFGEWWGSGINSGYGLVKGEKRFSLFNTQRWNSDNTPECCGVVPVLYKGLFNSFSVEYVIGELAHGGSFASPGFNDPEGIVIYHIAAKQYFKKTLKNDEAPKSAAA